MSDISWEGRINFLKKFITTNAKTEKKKLKYLEESYDIMLRDTVSHYVETISNTVTNRLE